MSLSAACPKCSSTSGGDWSQCHGSCPMPMSPHHDGQKTHVRCGQSHYAVIVEAQKDAAIYQRGDLDCPECLRCMVEKHVALAEVFGAKLAAIGGAR